MVLKGQAKKDYQRQYMKEYMRDLRSKGMLFRPNVKTSSVTDTDGMTYQVPELDADNNPIYEE